MTRIPRSVPRRAGVRGGQVTGVLRLTLALGLVLSGCSLDGLLNSDKLPPDVTDPAFTETPEGALTAYYGTMALFRNAFGAGTATSSGPNTANVITATGLLSDELVSARTSVPPEDVRTLPEGQFNTQSDETYSLLQKMRGQAGQTIGLLTRYQPDEPALAGRVYALQGYAEVFLAELFCSGIPLSTLDFEGDYTYRPGSSTEEVLAHARALFDTALTLAGDSAAVVNLARVGLGRALLASGRYAEAAAAVAPVPDGYRDTLTYPPILDTVGNVPNFARVVGTWPYRVANVEGGRGVDYITSGDPRTQVRSIGTLPGGGTQWHPAKYAVNGASPIVLASGVEARLIEAEAALQAQETEVWRATLNTLRTDGTQDGGGIYNPGTGGVAGLAPLTDPGTDSARVSLLFRERAFWLFLTGHRQGDLRRLLRQYSQYWPAQDRVYPVGPYTTTLRYGSDVTAPIPSKERLLNPLFTGCFTRQP